MHNIENIRSLCLALPGTTEDIKWGNDLCFCIAGKIFCVAGLAGPLTISFKVSDEDFDTLSISEGFTPAPYVARYKWVLLENPDKLGRKELEARIKKSHALVKSKLSKKTLKKLGLI